MLRRSFGELHAAIVCLFADPCGVQHKKSGPVHSIAIGGTTVRICWRHSARRKVRATCGGWHARSYSSFGFMVEKKIDCGRVARHQDEFFAVGSPIDSRPNRLRLAERLWRVCRQSIEHRAGKAIYRESERSSSKNDFPRRVHCDAQEARHRLRRKLRLER